jgi:tRNA pseudouridine55 synthase
LLKKSGRLIDLDGFINVNKDSGKSSHDVVAAVRRLFHCRARKIKVGHSGTLDPMATGVLPICLGKATRLAEFITDCPKTYRAKVVFGIETDSYDAYGAVVMEQSAAHIREQQVLDLFPKFCGRIEQIPPMVSALKYQGQPLYKLARAGQEVERKPREVSIYDIKYLGGDFSGDRPSVEIEIRCSKGTYIRSLAHDWGQLLAVGAHLAGLIRTEVGPFLLDEAYTIDELSRLAEANSTDFLLPLAYGIAHLPLLVAQNEQLQKLCHGNAVAWHEGSISVCRVEDENGRLLGIGQVKGGFLTMTKVLVGVN